MYSIGDLAQLGGVTPRLLRHYHDLCVLVPADVDADTGYRRYDVSQLADLLQILALKGLGFSLEEVKRVVDGGIGPAELRGMLVLRRSEVESEIAEATARLARVESRIERLEHELSDHQLRIVSVATKRLPSVHLAVASGVSASFSPEHVGPTIQPLYPVLLEALRAAGVEITGPSVAYYDEAPDGTVAVHAGFPVDASVTDVPGLEVVDLPEVELAATAVHHGDMATCDVDTVVPVFEWIREHGYRTMGYSRECYVDCPPDDRSAWRTEMQFPIALDPTD